MSLLRRAPEGRARRGFVAALIAGTALAPVSARAGFYGSYPLAAPLTGSETMGPVLQNGQDVTINAAALATLVFNTYQPQIASQVSTAFAPMLAQVQGIATSATAAQNAAASSASAAAASAQQAASSAASGGASPAAISSALASLYSKPGGPAQLGSDVALHNPVGSAAQPMLQTSYFDQKGTDPLFTDRNHYITQPCVPIATLTQSGTGGRCENWVDHLGNWAPYALNNNYTANDSTGAAAIGANTFVIQGFWTPVQGFSLVAAGSGTNFGPITKVVQNGSTYALTFERPFTEAVTSGEPFNMIQPDIMTKATAATPITSNTVTVIPGTDLAGVVPGKTLVIDTLAGGNGEILGMVASISGNVATLSFPSDYPAAVGDPIDFQGTSGNFFQSTAAASFPVTTNGQTTITLATAPPAGALTGNANIFAVDLDATSINGTNSFGLKGAGIGQVDAINGAVLTLHFPLEFPVAAGDRIALMNGNGPTDGGTADEVNSVALASSAISVVRGARGVCPGNSLNCVTWDMDYIAQSERGAFNATTIIGELQNNNHSGDNDFNYGFSLFNNGEFRNGGGYTMGKGISGGGWETGFGCNDGSNMKLACFKSGADGAQAAFLDTGKHNFGLVENGSPTQAFIVLSPAAQNYKNLFVVDPSGNIPVVQNITASGNISAASFGPTTGGGGVASFDSNANLNLPAGLNAYGSITTQNGITVAGCVTPAASKGGISFNCGGGQDTDLFGSVANGVLRLWQAGQTVEFADLGPTVAAFKEPVAPGTYTTATLPSGCTPGQQAYDSDGRKAGEAAGAGSGVPVVCTLATKGGSAAWFSMFSGAAVTN